MDIDIFYVNYSYLKHILCQTMINFIYNFSHNYTPDTYLPIKANSDELAISIWDLTYIPIRIYLKFKLT